jgi:hypothetical protein
VIDTIAEYAPNLRQIVHGRQVLTPLDLEREWSLTEGNIFQGELTLEQLFFQRPVPGWAQYRTPDPQSLYVRRGHASGRGNYGCVWEECGLGDTEQELGDRRKEIDCMADREPAKTFEDLIVWQKAHALVLDVYRITRSFPREEVYGLTSQLRRAATSVPANIAEGFKKRGRADKARILNSRGGVARRSAISPASGHRSGLHATQ